MRNSQDDRLSRVDDIGIDRRNLELGDHESAGWNGGIADVRVEDEEPAVGRVVRMKSQTEEALLPAGFHLAADVEERPTSATANATVT